MIYGTSYFPTNWDAVKYYEPMGYHRLDVMQMISKGEIHIGKPPGLNARRRAVLRKDQGGSTRYFIHEDVRVG